MTPNPVRKGQDMYLCDNNLYVQCLINTEYLDQFYKLFKSPT